MQCATLLPRSHTWNLYYVAGKNPGSMKTFTKDELAKYNGKNGMPAYIAHKGKVYDATGSSLWEMGEHQGMHVAGQDLTKDVLDAPHEEDVLTRLPQVGDLV